MGCTWEYNSPQNWCWYWKKLNRVKLLFRDGFVGDSWHSDRGPGYTIASGYKWLLEDARICRAASVI